MISRKQKNAKSESIHVLNSQNTLFDIKSQANQTSGDEINANGIDFTAGIHQINNDIHIEYYNAAKSDLKIFSDHSDCRNAAAKGSVSPVIAYLQSLSYLWKVSNFIDGWGTAVLLSCIKVFIL